MNERDEKRGLQRLQMNREELVEQMQKLVLADGATEVLPGLFLARLSKPVNAQAIFQPAFCFVIQGSKQVLVGEDVFRYDPGNYLIYTVDLPMIFKVEKATKDKPYLGFRLNLDPVLVAEVMMESGVAPKKSDESVKAIDVRAVDIDLVDAVVRLFRILDKSGEREMLAPLIIKEIVYRLLSRGQGARLSHLLTSTGDTRRISKAIGHLREHYNQPLKIENIARELGMSISGFHHHFKSVTAMTPLQFQKQMRLQEARRLMLGGDMDAAAAGFRVGYDDPAYFSRDYKKMFGAPPQRDIANLRNGLTA